jgi:hypothetical protein
MYNAGIGPEKGAEKLKSEFFGTQMTLVLCIIFRKLGSKNTRFKRRALFRILGQKRLIPFLSNLKGLS